MSPLLVFAICIAAAIAVGYLRSLGLAEPVTVRNVTPSPTTRMAPKRAASRPVETGLELDHPEAA